MAQNIEIPDIDTSDVRKWAESWLTKYEWEIDHQAEGVYAGDSFSLVCDMAADAPWTQPQQDEFQQIVRANPRYRRIADFIESECGEGTA